MPEYVFHPDWLNDDHMLEKGYEKTYDKGGYLKYINRAGVVSTTYGPMGHGKRIISINCNNLHLVEYFYIGIQEDGGTRTAFSGIIYTEEQLDMILKLII